MLDWVGFSGLSGSPQKSAVNSELMPRQPALDVFWSMLGMKWLSALAWLCGVRVVSQDLELLNSSSSKAIELVWWDLREFKWVEDRLLRFDPETPCTSSCLNAWSPDVGDVGGSYGTFRSETWLEEVVTGGEPCRFVTRHSLLPGLP